VVGSQSVDRQLTGQLNLSSDFFLRKSSIICKDDENNRIILK
jgi:hypothetical protein